MGLANTKVISRKKKKKGKDKDSVYYLFLKKIFTEFPAAANGIWLLFLPLHNCRCPASRQHAHLQPNLLSHIASSLIFWHKAYLPYATPVTCLICVPRLPWGRTKLCKSPPFKQILWRCGCIILTHFLILFTYHSSSLSPLQLNSPFHFLQEKCMH